MAAKKGKRAGAHVGNRLADMSLPPELRGRRSGGRAADPVPAQMQHGGTPAGRRRARDGERKMHRARVTSAPQGPARVPEQEPREYIRPG